MLRIATRGSQLARWQAEWIARLLAELEIDSQLVEVVTRGDIEQSDPVASIGTQGVFTKEVQRAVLEGGAELAVHSLKDLPTEQAEGLVLAAVPERADCRDALVARSSNSLQELPHGAVVGTGSKRRRALLLVARPDLKVEPLRGNVDTRIRKLDEGRYDAIVLAAAGLKRLGLEDRITELLEPPTFLPAPSQGAVGIECRADDPATQAILRKLDHAPTRVAVTAERAMLAKLHGGCLVPVGAWGRVRDERLRLDGVVASTDGAFCLRAVGSAPLDEAEALGGRVAEDLLNQGAAAVIDACRDAPA